MCAFILIYIQNVNGLLYINTKARNATNVKRLINMSFTGGFVWQAHERAVLMSSIFSLRAARVVYEITRNNCDFRVRTCAVFIYFFIVENIMGSGDIDID